MTETEAIAYAAEWGSYMCAGDPGACMYGFSPETGLKVQSEQHRTACLDWIEKCKEGIDYVNNDPLHLREIDRLNELAQMIRESPVVS